MSNINLFDGLPSPSLIFIKDENANVLLEKLPGSVLIASFNPGQNVIKDVSNPNKFKIQSEASFGDNPFVIDYRDIDGWLCSPQIFATNLNDFLIELSEKFFFEESNQSNEGLANKVTIATGTIGHRYNEGVMREPLFDLVNSQGTVQQFYSGSDENESGDLNAVRYKINGVEKTLFSLSSHYQYQPSYIEITKNLVAGEKNYFLTDFPPFNFPHMGVIVLNPVGVEFLPVPVALGIFTGAWYYKVEENITNAKIHLPYLKGEEIKPIITANIGG